MKMNNQTAAAFTVLLLFILMFLLLAPTAHADTDVSRIKPDSVSVIVMPAEPVPNAFITQGGSYLLVYPPTVQQTETSTQAEEPKTEKPKQNTESTTVSVPAEVPAPDGETKPAEEEIPETDTLTVDITLLTNEEREKAGLKKLVYNSDLQAAADLRAKECATSFSHTRPDGSSCFTAITLDYEVAGENLIMADGPLANAETMMKTWMNSEGHRANILLPDYTEIAVGVYQSDNTVYAVQLFLKPMS